LRPSTPIGNICPFYFNDSNFMQRRLQSSLFEKVEKKLNMF